VTAAEMGRLNVDLHDPGVIWIELTPGEVAPQQQQCVACHYGVIAARRAEHSGHPDVEGVVVFDEILGPRCMRHRRLQSICQGHDLIVRALAPRTAVNRNPFAPIQDLGDTGEIGVARTSNRQRDVYREGWFIWRVGLRRRRPAG
jgi:hypothetical protein